MAELPLIWGYLRWLSLLILEEEYRLARLDRLHGFDRAHLGVRLLLVDVTRVIYSLVVVLDRCPKYVTVFLHF